MPFQIPTVDEVRVAASIADVPVTDAQADAIIETVKNFESRNTDCLGLKSWHIASGEHAFAQQFSGPKPFVEVHFHYLHGDPQQLESAPLGLEVTLFSVDGTVRSSQDYG